MKVFEILKFNREILGRLRSMGLRMEDCDYIGLYQEYEEMYSRGEKVTYIVSHLVEKYSVCERKVYEIIKRFGKHCTDYAA